MQVRFSSSRPVAPSTLALPVAGAVDAAALAALLSAPQPLVERAIAAARFQGDAGTLAELFVPADASATHVFLVGVGKDGSVEGYEKAGAALVARLIASGATSLVVDFSSIASDLTGDAAARFVFGSVLRAWRHDAYRTKLPQKSRVSLAEIIFAGAPDGAESAWERLSAVAEGVAFTRELVTEPANIIYPESFVERCQSLTGLGVEIDVLDEDAMRSAGMGALLGVSQGSERPARLLVMRWNGSGDAATPPVALVGRA